jgi:rod shape-determining protein MreD
MLLPRATDQLLLPVNPFFVAFTLVLAFVANMLPTASVAGMPDWLAIVLVFWNVHQPRKVGLGVAFLFGLLMDVHEGARMGQHALAYTLLSFGAIAVHRRLLWFGPLAQAVQILPLFVVAKLVSVLARLSVGGMFPGWGVMLSPFFEALMWPLATLLLLAPQRRAPDRDANRPL